MTIATEGLTTRATGWRWPVVLTLALRELRSGLSGFYVFLACIALGVAVIAGVGALSDALRAGFERQGEALLGGDVTLARSHKAATEAERRWIATHGKVSEAATLRSMARTAAPAAGADEQALIELKAIDDLYPLSGTLTLSSGVTASTALAGRGAAVEPILLDRLGIKLGDRIKLGRTEVEVRATIVAEPDKIADRLTYGPRVLVSLDTLKASQLAEPGSLVRWRYALKLAAAGPTADNADLVRFRDKAKADLPESGFIIADRRDPSPSVSRTLERLRQFLTLVGLTSLIVGGVGVASAVATYMDRRRKVIATLKALGARQRTITALHLVQILIIGLLGIGIGLGLGMLMPLALDATIGAALPIRGEFVISARSVLTAIAYGLLVTLLFTVWPLGRAGRIRAASLFRDDVQPARTSLPWTSIASLIVIAALLAVLAILSSEDRRIASFFLLGIAGVFAVFLGLGQLVTLVARTLPRPRRPELSLALGSLGAPGGLTRSVVLALGSGLSLLVTLSLADASIRDELTARIPKGSPNYFILDLPRDDRDRHDAIVKRHVAAAEVRHAPMLRGRLVKLGDRPAETVKASPKASWVLQGDRGLTYAEDVPEGSKVTAGAWWPKDYQGEPLVSFEGELAKDLGLKIGDSVTVNILGRDVTARIASFRELKWESLAINFVMVFSPNTLSGAPHNLLATITLPADTALVTEAAIARDLGRELPGTTAIRVKDAINAFGTLFAKIMTAVRVAAGITLAA
ncbi:MAG TPA: FtsX-like permease family protein, partial [Hyphomicrobiaceae bacterium]|nr:FtsX-like permease family protein [Hyphomicrobiaceae bacterium]